MTHREGAWKIEKATARVWGLNLKETDTKREGKAKGVSESEERENRKGWNDNHEKDERAVSATHNLSLSQQEAIPINYTSYHLLLLSFFFSVM